jgi:hypothetical protein
VAAGCQQVTVPLRPTTMNRQLASSAILRRAKALRGVEDDAGRARLAGHARRERDATRNDVAVAVVAACGRRAVVGDPGVGPRRDGDAPRVHEPRIGVPPLGIAEGREVGHQARRDIVGRGTGRLRGRLSAAAASAQNRRRRTHEDRDQPHPNLRESVREIGMRYAKRTGPRAPPPRPAAALARRGLARGGAAARGAARRRPGAALVVRRGTAAQAAIAAAALAATELGRVRNGVEQAVSVDMRHAALDCCTHFSIDGVTPSIWDKLSGLYACGDGWVRIHANFAHHRDGALRVLGLPPGPDTERDAVTAALSAWQPLDFEQACSDAGLVVAALRTFDAWDRHPQAAALATQPLMHIEKVGEAPARALPPLPQDARPLQGVRVLDLTRILAGPVGTRALAAYGADVMLVNAPHLPNIEAIAETSRGKLSAHADLRQAADRRAFEQVLKAAHVYVQGYRPGGLATLGYGAQEAAALSPGIVTVSLSAYGPHGPWAGRRGFDSLVQTATGFNAAEAEACGSGPPRALPMQILDHATGYLIALGAQAALLRQQAQGGSWHVQVSLARTAAWLRSLGRVPDGFAAPRAAFDGYMETTRSGFGELAALRHAAQLERTPAAWPRPSMPPGTHALAWPC